MRLRKQRFFKWAAGLVCGLAVAAVPAGAAAAEPVNLAVGAKVDTDMFAWYLGDTQTTATGGTVNYLIDGDRNTSGRGYYEVTPYITLDFGAETVFNALVLAEKADSSGYTLRGFTFSGSQDGLRWTELLSGTAVGEHDLRLELDAAVSFRYLKFQITHKTDPNRPVYIRDIEVYNLPFAPEAEEAAIVKTPEGRYVRVNDSLYGEYGYSDRNNDPDTASIYQWYWADTPDWAGAEPIPGANQRGYTVRETDVGGYLWFAVTPGNEAAEFPMGKTAVSGAAGPVRQQALAPCPPAAEELSVNGPLYPDGILTGAYIYVDENDEEESRQDLERTLVQWERAEQEDGPWTVIGLGDSYVIRQEDLGQYIRFAVFPVSLEEPANGSWTYAAAGMAVQHPAAADAEALGLPGEASRDIVLPVRGSKGAAIVWNSDTPDAIAADGTVHRGDTDRMVTLTAEVTFDEKTVKRTFSVRVPRKETQTAAGGGGGRHSSAGRTISFDSSAVKLPEPALLEPEQTGPSQPAEETPRLPFQDMEAYDWAEEAVAQLYAKGIVSGDSETVFAPARGITRAEAVKLALKSVGLEPSGVPGTVFRDVDSGVWYAGWVAAAEESGIVSGMADGKFAPEEPVSRQDFAVMLVRAAAQIDMAWPNLAAVEFIDGDDIADYAGEAAAILGAAGVLCGDERGALRPAQVICRAEAAVVLYRFINL